VLEVDIDKILPVTEARDNFNKIIDEVEGTEAMYVLTKNGKPSAVIVGVNHLEKLTGKTADELTSIVEKKADETPVVEEISSPAPLGDNVAGGSNLPETDDVTAGQSIQVGSATDSSPIDVPVEVDDAPPASVGEAPVPEVAPVPTSSPGSVAQSSPAPPLSVVNAALSAAPLAGAPLPNVAPNQAPAAAPTENGAAASDSDLFV